MKQNQNTPDKELNKFLDLISKVGDQALSNVLKQQGLKMEDLTAQSAPREEHFSKYEESVINSLIKEGKAQTREEAIKMLQDSI